MRKLKMFSCIGALIAVMGLVGTSMAADQVVNDDAAGSGAEPPPCNVAPDETVVQDGIDAAGGDTVLVCPGTYAEDLTITGPSNNGLRLVGVDMATSIIEGVFTNDETLFPQAIPNINIVADEVEIRNLTIRSPAGVATDYSSGIVLTGTDILIRDNYFETAGGDPGSVVIQTWFETNAPVDFQDISGLTIQRNTFRNRSTTCCFGWEAIFINSQSDPDDPDNPVKIFHNDFMGNMYRGVGIWDRPFTHVKHNHMTTDLSPTDTTDFSRTPWGVKTWLSDGHSIKKNTISSAGAGDFSTDIAITLGSNDNSIVNNTLNSETGVLLDGSDGNKVVNNKISGTTVNGVSLVDADDNKVVNNKIACASGTGITLDATSDNNKIQVNRFTSCSPKTDDTAGGTGNRIKNK